MSFRRTGYVPLLRAAVALTVGTLAIAAGGCGTAHHDLPGDRIRGQVLTIYTSLPLVGQSEPGAEQVLEGEQLALEQAGGHVGRLRLVLRTMNDATVGRDGWDPGQTSLNAHVAVQDPTTIAYLGDFNSGASAVALPILNRLGIPQISPTSGAVGLTSAGPGASPGEPGKYYPTRLRTFMTMMPDDVVQATTLLALQRSLGCHRPYVFDDGGFDGYDAAAAYQQEAVARNIRLTGVASFPLRAPDYTSLATAVAQSGADCVLVSAEPEPGPAALVAALVRAMPHGWMVATAGLAQPAFTTPARGGVPAAAASRVLLSAPVGAVGAAGQAFASAFTARFGTAPDLFAPYGYEAMRVLIAAIRRATRGGATAARRSRVLAALFGARQRSGPLGPFRIRPDGATTLRRYGVYLLRGGRPVLWYATG